MIQIVETIETVKNKITVAPGQTISFRPTLYDVVVLEAIARAHPYITDTSGLVRYALGEYQNSRKGGSKSEKMEECLSILRFLEAQHKRGVDAQDAVAAKHNEFDGCDNPPGGEEGRLDS